MDTEGCTGVDYYKQQSGKCWFIGEMDQTLLDDGACIHFEVNTECPGQTCEYPLWDRYTKQSGVGMSKKESGHTEESCKKACLSTPNCMSVDYFYDVTGNCFFGFTSYPQLHISQSSVHLDLDGTCPGCDYFWYRYSQTSTRGLTHKETGHTEASCKQACIDTNDCYYVDYYPLSKFCWFGYNEDAETFTDATSIHIALAEHCPALHCDIKWTRYSETQGSEMTVYETGHSEDSCKQACVDTWGCTGVNYYKEPSKTCWFGFTTGPVQASDKASVYMAVEITCPEGDKLQSSSKGSLPHRKSRNTGRSNA